MNKVKVIILCGLFAILGCSKPLNFLYFQPGAVKAITGCPESPQSILIIDFKSGWWEGDGGSTFTSIQQYISGTVCNKITLEYGHMTTVEDGDGTAAAFPSQPFSSYTEIWILSGATGDPEDLRTDGATFQRFLQGITSTNANLFLGAGYGTTYHINAITSALGLGNLVNPGASNDLVFLTGDGSDVITTMTQITNIPTGNPLFAGVTTLPDQVSVNGSTMVPDQLVTNSHITPLVTTSAGITEIGSVTLPNRKIIMDSDLPRLYQILNSDVNVRNYIVNLISVLEQ